MYFLMNTRAINSVFNITSSSGITTCLKTAEEKLKKSANEDLCYYNTCLKRHNLFYEKDNWEEGKLVELKTVPFYPYA